MELFRVLNQKLNIKHQVFLMTFKTRLIAFLKSSDKEPSANDEKPQRDISVTIKIDTYIVTA